jgi:hypothetical protein
MFWIPKAMYPAVLVILGATNQPRHGQGPDALTTFRAREPSLGSEQTVAPALDVNISLHRIGVESFGDDLHPVNQEMEMC